jgi:lipopolysaccharide biosynthesis protein
MKNRDKFMIIAHYHSSGSIRKDLIDLIRVFNKKFKEIIFVSTNLKKTEISKIKNISKIIIRKNEGYDFYSYKIGMDYLLKKYSNLDNKSIFLTASSLFYIKPIKLLQKIDKIRNFDNKVIALSKSWEIKEHIQSDMFYFSTNLLRNNEFLNWWMNIKKYKSRQKIIENYEIPLLEFLKKNNLNVDTLFKKNIEEFPHKFIEKLSKKIHNIFFKKKKIYKKNPTHFYWQDIYKKFGLIKIDLIKTNPHDVDLEQLKNFFKKKDLLEIKKQALSN